MSDIIDPDSDRPLMRRALRVLATSFRSEVTTYARDIVRMRWEQAQGVEVSKFEERDFVLEIAVEERSKALDKLAAVMETDAFRLPFCEFLNAETEIALCGKDLCEYFDNRDALLAEEPTELPDQTGPTDAV